jgi:hypothetical protein
VVYLDGINENRELSRLDALLQSFLAEYQSLPVRFVITCRDIFWSFFSESSWMPFLFGGRPHDLPAFSEREIDSVIDVYFQHFEITGVITGKARQKCCHPLLLRFFCEAYRGTDIRRFEDLRLKDLFEEYWRRKNGEIATALGLSNEGAYRVEEFLFRLGNHMSEHRVTRIVTGEIAAITGETDLDTDKSLYQRFLDEDIILEEMPPETSFDPFLCSRRVCFVYDEFYDYILALSHIRRMRWDALSTPELFKDFVKLVEDSKEFEQFRGVAEYLVLISERRDLHRVLCGILAKMGRYEILCSLLPKLRGDNLWMAPVLSTCLNSIAENATIEQQPTASSKRKRMAGLQQQVPNWKTWLDSVQDPSELFQQLTGQDKSE